MARAVADPALDLATPFKGRSRPCRSTPGRKRRRCGPAGGPAAGFIRSRRRRGRGARRGRRGRLRPRRRPADRVAGAAAQPLRRAGEIVAFRSDGDTIEHVALLIGAERRSAAGAGAQRMPDRRRVRLAEMRLRAAAQRRARSPPRAGASCSICARKGAASAWSTSCAPMRCRTRASTPSTPTSARLRGRRARLPRWRADAEALAQPRIRLLTNNPRKVAALNGDRGGRGRACASPPASTIASSPPTRPRQPPALGERRPRQSWAM